MDKEKNNSKIHYNICLNKHFNKIFEGFCMTPIDIINIGADTVLVATFIAGIRIHLSKFRSLEDKLSKTLTEDETKKLVSSELENHLKIIHYQLNTIHETLKEIVKISVKS